MTSADDRAIRRKYYHADYMKRREKRLEYARDYAKKHRERINFLQRERRRRLKESPPEQPARKPLSTTAIEAFLPPKLYNQRLRLRVEYLKIHISERPPYDYFLRCKTIEHLRKNINRNYDRRE